MTIIELEDNAKNMAYNKSQINRYRVPKIIVGILILLVGIWFFQHFFPGFVLMGLFGWTGDSQMSLRYNVEVRLGVTFLIFCSVLLIFSGVQFIRNIINRKTLLSLLIAVIGLILAFAYANIDQKNMANESREMRKMREEDDIQIILENESTQLSSISNKNIFYFYPLKSSTQEADYPGIIVCNIDKKDCKKAFNYRNKMFFEYPTTVYLVNNTIVLVQNGTMIIAVGTLEGRQSRIDDAIILSQIKSTECSGQLVYNSADSKWGFQKDCAN